MLALLAPYDLPVALKTGAASAGAGLWRIFIMPIDALKTTLQVEGRTGVGLLANKVKRQGPTVLWHGALAAFSATAVGHFPWFFTFNFLQEKIPTPPPEEKMKKLGRNALIGFCSSVVSDTTSNSLRVIKTTRQTFSHVVSYREVVRQVVEKDGLLGLFGRGLKTRCQQFPTCPRVTFVLLIVNCFRLLANGMQGLMFSVLYKFFMETQERRSKGE